MLPAEFALFKSVHVEPKRKAYELAVANSGGKLVAQMSLIYAAALARYIKMMAEHRYAEPRFDEPSFAPAFRTAIAAERRWAADEMSRIAPPAEGPD